MWLAGVICVRGRLWVCGWVRGLGRWWQAGISGCAGVGGWVGVSWGGCGMSWGGWVLVKKDLQLRQGGAGNRAGWVGGVLTSFWVGEGGLGMGGSVAVDEHGSPATPRRGGPGRRRIVAGGGGGFWQVVECVGGCGWDVSGWEGEQGGRVEGNLALGGVGRLGVHEREVGFVLASRLHCLDQEEVGMGMSAPVGVKRRAG